MVQFMLTDKKIRPVHYGRHVGLETFRCPHLLTLRSWHGLPEADISGVFLIEILNCMPTEQLLPIVISEPKICPLSMLDVSVTPKLVFSFSNQPTQTLVLVNQVIADPRCNKTTILKL